VQYCILRPLRERQAPPINVVIATLGVAIIARNIALAVWGPDAQYFPSPVSADPISIGVLNVTALDILIVIIGIALMLFLHFFLQRTKEGKALRAVAQDRYGAILESLKKTSRIVFIDEDVPGGTTAYMLQEVIEKQGGYSWLDAPPRTLTGTPHRPAYGSDGDYWSKPNAEQVFEVAYALMHEADPGKYPVEGW
jgi:hypothetical protein